MNYLKPSQLSENSIIVIEFNSGRALIFFINKCVPSTLTNDVVCIYGRSTKDLILNYDRLDIENETKLIVYQLGLTSIQKGVKGYRKLTTLEKQYFAKEIEFLKIEKKASAKKMFQFFQKALFRSRVSRSFTVNKDQSASSGD